MKNKSKNTVNAWTTVTIFCYLRNSKCRGCYYYQLLGKKCKTKVSVKKLLETVGEPSLNNIRDKKIKIFTKEKKEQLDKEMKRLKDRILDLLKEESYLSALQISTKLNYENLGALSISLKSLLNKRLIREEGGKFYYVVEKEGKEEEKILPLEKIKKINYLTDTYIKIEDELSLLSEKLLELNERRKRVEKELNNLIEIK